MHFKVEFHIDTQNYKMTHMWVDGEGPRLVFQPLMGHEFSDIHTQPLFAHFFHLVISETES